MKPKGLRSARGDRFWVRACQWPGCPYDSAHRVSRTAVGDLSWWVCERHLHAFRDLPYGAEKSMAWQRDVVRHVNASEVP